MRITRLMIVILLLIFMMIVTTTIAQDEATEEPEVTEEPVTAEPEMTEEAESTEEPSEDMPVDGSTYVVQVGDNLFRIALRFGLTTNELATANNIANPSLIFVGQQLIIPGVDDIEEPEATPAPTEEPEMTEEPEATDEPAPETTETPDGGGNDDEPVEGGSYTVQAGDNLFRIALRNGTTISTLLSLNPSIVNQNLIFVGQRIVLPGDLGVGDEGDNGPNDDGAGIDDEDENMQVANVEMVTGIEVLLGDDPIANASLATQLGVDWVKITVNWADIEPEEGNADFTALDAAVNAFDTNFDVMLTLTGAPDWSRPSATDLANEQPAYGPPDDLDTFGAFVEAVASRYVGQVNAYEIWFQPNNRITWLRTNVDLRSDGFPDAGLSDVRYIDLLEVAYDAVNAVDSQALVITAGLAPTGINDNYNSIDNFVFFEALLEQGAANFSDGFGVHVDGFSNAPDATCCGDADSDPGFDESIHFFFANTIDQFRTILNDNGQASAPLWVTRFGWGTTEGASGDGTGLEFVTLNTAQEQADYISSALTIGDERGDVGVMILYNLNGCGVGDTNACYYSLIDASGNAREAFNTIVSGG